MAKSTVKYVGNCDWAQSNIPILKINAKGGAEVTVEYRGRADKQEEFIAKFQILQQCTYTDSNERTINQNYLFLTDISSDEKFPFPTVSIRYEGQVAETAKAGDNEYSERTVTKSITINKSFGAGVTWTNGRKITGASREIVYDTQEASITIYAMSRPGPSSGMSPSAIPIKVQSITTTITYTGDGEEKSIVTDANLPAGVEGALKPTEEFVTNGFAPRKVSGTQWWEATYTQAREYVSP